ncbi:hypothetical protein OHC33_002690 [Knufia fluminis]|uniref:Lipase B n=1 Tax=Knufia fluminis TaxID=191047 RepID=A0AAN8I5W0_9EURO|nr:hypothetical protein OHC33_002690 [Knufia fluminis]
MYTPLKLASLALPLVTAIPHKSGISDIYTRDAVTDVITDATNIVGQVNAALGDILPSAIGTSDLLEIVLTNIRQQAFEIGALEATFAGLLQASVANFLPTDIPNALDRIVNTVNSTDSTIENAAQLILNGLSVTDLTQNVLAGYLSGINSFNSVNPAPTDTIYPKKQPQDAPYTVPEAQLRAAIFIPPAFTYGQKRPILFVPGTGAFGGVNFISNLGKLLGNDDRFDPVYLNVPGAMLDDTQINSEYIAYAINYLASITGNRNDLAVIPWSQGNLDTQWVFQYWPSTRLVVTDFISASADFHGSTLPYLLDPALVNPPLPPSIIQQEYDSNFVLTLRYGGGTSPYVPSTSVHSITDEIVQPQYSPFASADYFSQDLPGTLNTNAVCPVLRNISYTNNQIQTVCAGQPAGQPYTHEGVLYHPLTYALVLDALTNDGPGRLDRIDLDTVCAQLVAPGLSLDDVLATEGIIPLALVNILLYPEKVTNEPAVMQYALQANAQCAVNGTNTTSSSTSSSIAAATTTTTTTLLSTTTATTTSTETTSTTASASSTVTSSTSGSATTTPVESFTSDSSTSKSGTTSHNTLTTSEGTTLTTSTHSHSGSASESTTSSKTSETPTTSYGSPAATTTYIHPGSSSAGTSSQSMTSDASTLTTTTYSHSRPPSSGSSSNEVDASSALTTTRSVSRPPSTNSMTTSTTRSHTVSTTAPTQEM